MVLPNSIVTQLNEIQKEFIWIHKILEVKEKTLPN